MFLIIGLGNPGSEYRSHRHNIGFHIIDALQQAWSMPEFTFNKKLNALISAGKYNDHSLILAKPTTYVNLSGVAAVKIGHYYKIEPSQWLIIHDDADLLFGTIRFSKNRGHGGHRGIASVIEQTKTKDFLRLRFGISPSYTRPKSETFVLKPFNKREQGKLNSLISLSVHGIQLFLQEGYEHAMSEINR